MKDPKKLGKAFALGMVFAKSKKIAQDEAKWITVHPNGKGTVKSGGQAKGRPVLIDGETGEVLGGIGGKFNGKNIKSVGGSQERKKQRADRRESLRQMRNESRKIDLTLPKKIDQSKILQNRERSNKGSIMQMRAIARDPDYERLGPSKDFGNGAPVIAYGSIPKRQLGKIETATMSDGSKYLVQYAVVDASQVLTSNDINGNKNKEYYSDDPSKMRAIAGNGRITGLTHAYKAGKADNYQDNMAIDTDSHGIPEQVIDSVKNPILVRVMQPKDVTPDIGDKSNTTGQLTMTAVEQANNDRHRVNFDKIEFYENGDPTLDSIKEFVAQMPPSEQASLIDVDGNPTRLALDRLHAAIFSKAYDNDSLTRLLSQALEPESKTILNGLLKAAPKMQKLEGLPDGYDVRDIVAKAAERAVNARRSGRKLDDESRQTSFMNTKDDDNASSAIVDLFAKNSRNSQTIGDKLSKMADYIYQEATKEGFDLFGEVEKLPRNEAVRNGLAKDQKLKKMSQKAQDYWYSKGWNFLMTIFDGNPDASFLSQMRQDIRN